MNYRQISIETTDQEQKEILLALLENIGYEGFEEQDNALVAYIPSPDYDEEQLKEILSPYELGFSTETIEQRNWNAQWESNFEPVIVEGFCTVRAGFHQLEVKTPYEIVITPKMSFGTGHHATTKLMMEQMSRMGFEGKKVLDFGTGTGILAILAQMLGAGEIEAIDNDEWSYENALENTVNNNASSVVVKQGSLEISTGKYDIILANINRHILLQYMADMYDNLFAGGQLLLSGILVEDRDIVTEAAKQAGFSPVNASGKDNWMCLLFKKIAMQC